MFLRKTGLALAMLVLLAGTVLRLTLQDQWQFIAPFFYALPLPVLAAGWLMVAIGYGWKKRRGLISLLLALGCCAWWLGTAYRQPGFHPAGRPALKVLFWNLAHEKLPHHDLEQIIKDQRPDIGAFVEVGARHGDPAALVTNLPSGWKMQKLDHAMSVVARGDIVLLNSALLPGPSKFHELNVRVDGRVWRVFVVDIVSEPQRPRGDALRRILAQTVNHDHTLVLGDFNTPIESRHFKAWHREFHQAFDEAGSGLRETWPRWAPVLTIDHIWSSGDAPPLRAEKLWRSCSDHAALLVELKPR